MSSINRTANAEPSKAITVWLEVAGRIFESVRSVIGYVSLTATLLTGLALLLDRSFAAAALTFLAELVGPLSELPRYAQSIVSTWSAYVVQPIQLKLIEWFNIQPPVWAIEVSTLVLFATGPTLRAVWTARAKRARIHQRLHLLERLRAELAQRAGDLAKLNDVRQTLQKALDSKDWNKLKAAGGMLMALGAGLADILLFLNKQQPVWRSAAIMRTAVQTWNGSYNDWNQVERDINRLTGAALEQTAAVQAISDRIARLEAGDEGLLEGLDDVKAGAADQIIRTYVERKMRVSVAISRIAIAFAAAVVVAYLIDWMLLRS